jgi:hypothetical protein
MPAFSLSHSPKRDARSALRALLALSFGWLLVLCLAPTAGVLPAEPVHVTAELRVSEQAPAPVADVGVAQASLRALHARVRSTLQPLQALTSGTSRPGALVRLQRLHAQRTVSAVALAERAPKRRQACSWPLPRCQTQVDRQDDDEDGKDAARCA